MKITFAAHALFEMKRRGILKRQVLNLLRSPRAHRIAAKKRTLVQGVYFDDKERKKMLLRVITERLPNKITVITAYKTSKIKKYQGALK